jgi:type I restriction enzyme S subunit
MFEGAALRFGDLGEIFDGPHATPNRVESGPYFLNISSLLDGRLELEKSDHVSEEEFIIWTRRVTPRANDLLFSYETRLGEAALMPPGIRASLGRRMALLRPNLNIVDPKFLLYFYLGPAFRRTINERTIHGATVNRIGLSTMADWPVSVPALSRQRAIAEVLGALDDKIAANLALAQTLELLASAHYEQLRSDGTDIVRLSDLVSTQYGLTTSATDSPGPKFLRVTDINKKPWVEWDSTPNCVISDADLAKYLVSPGDILVARMADPGKTAFIDPGSPSAVFASYLVRLIPNEVQLAQYIYYFLRSSEYKNYADGAMQGSVQMNMNAKVIVATDIVLPPLNALEEFNDRVSNLRASMMSALRENRTLADLRDTLLPQLMSGKLRVRDAEKSLEEVL